MPGTDLLLIHFFDIVCSAVTWVSLVLSSSCAVGK